MECALFTFLPAQNNCCPSAHSSINGLHADTTIETNKFLPLFTTLNMLTNFLFLFFVLYENKIQVYHLLYNVLLLQVEAFFQFQKVEKFHS